jgi:outer membrane protein assembly factor BamB
MKPGTEKYNRRNKTMNKAQLIATIAGATLAIASSANAETLIFAGNQGVIHELDTVTGEVTFRGVCSGPVSSMIVNDNTLYLGDHNGTVYAYDIDTNFVVDAFSVPSDANAMAWLADQLVVADSSGEINYIDATTHEVIDTTTAPGTDVTAMGIDAGGLFVGGQSSIALRTHIGQDDYEFFAACGSLINSIAFGSDEMYLGGIAFGGAESGTVYIFDKFAGGIVYTGTHGVESDVTSMVYSDGFLYIAGSDGVIHEMDPTTGVISRTFETGIDIQAMTPESGAVSCPSDYDASGELNFLDISRFIELFNEELVPADTNGDNQFNFFDISTFIENLAGGC